MSLSSQLTNYFLITQPDFLPNMVNIQRIQPHFVQVSDETRIIRQHKILRRELSDSGIRETEVRKSWMKRDLKALYW